ncbi:MAG: glycosyltransferase family 39 protein [Polyangiaceae bacterium]
MSSQASGDPGAPPSDAPLRETDGQRGAMPRAWTFARAADVALVPACVAVIALSIGLVLTFDYGRDQAIYALVARELVHGKMPYRDAFDFKPPGIFMVYAVARALFGGAQFGIRVLEAISMIGTAAGLVRLAKSHLGDAKIGFVAAGLASQVHAQLDFWHTGQPETFGGTLTILGLVLTSVGLGFGSNGLRREPPSKWLRLGAFVGAGALFGLAGLMKPPLAGGGAVVAVAAAAHVWSHRDRAAPLRATALEAAKPIGAIALGGALPIALVLLWFKAKGALGDLHDVLFVFTPFYTKLSWEGRSFYPMAWFGITQWLTGYSSALLAGLVATLIVRPKPSDRWLLLTAVALIGVHIAGVVMQGKFFPYHWGATFPLTALVGAVGVTRIYEGAAKRGPLWLVPTVVAFGIAASFHAPVPNLETFTDRSKRRFDLFVKGPMNVDARDELASVADVDARENRAVAEWVKAHTKPSDTIFVWGFECVIYDLADRPIASRYIYDVPQRATWSKVEMQKKLMPELDAAKPAAIVVEHRDVFPDVTGDNYDSAGSLYGFRELQELLWNRYERATTIGDFDVYLRSELTSDEAPPSQPEGEEDGVAP